MNSIEFSEPNIVNETIFRENLELFQSSINNQSKAQLSLDGSSNKMIQNRNLSTNRVNGLKSKNEIEYLNT